MRSLAALCLLLFTCAACTSSREADPSGPPAPTLTPQYAATEALFIGAHAVDTAVVWLSGTGGTYARTTDGGATWQTGTVPGADSLQFRDVHAVDAETALLLSIGPGEQSRIYRTADGGATWAQVFTNPEPEGFFDCMAFWDAAHGLAFSDAVDGTFLIVTTADGGQTWARVPAARLPAAQPGEGSFAASGTCVVTQGDSTAWIGTGNAATARLLQTTDRGRTWTATAPPLVGGEAAGIASVAFRDARHGVALGGDIAHPDVYAENVVRTADGGATWTPGGRLPFPGAVYGAAYVPGTQPPVLTAVGPGGAAYSRDDGLTWTALDTLTYWSLTFAGPSAGWLVGPDGRIRQVRFTRSAAPAPDSSAPPAPPGS